MLGKKRNFENFRQKQTSQNNVDSNHFSSNQKNNIITVPKISKKLTHLYNMKRSICLTCAKPKNKKYSTNNFIPCIPFPISS